VFWLISSLFYMPVSYFLHCYTEGCGRLVFLPDWEVSHLLPKHRDMPCWKLLCLPRGVDVGTNGRKVLQTGNVTCTTSLTGESLLTLIRAVSCIPTAADWVMGAGNKYTTTSVKREVAAVSQSYILPSDPNSTKQLLKPAILNNFFPRKAPRKITFHFARNPWQRKHLQAWKSWKRGMQLEYCQIIVMKICV
jgi:hypothetical protein